MQNLITWLLVIIQYQEQLISFLCVLVFWKEYKPKPEKCTDKKYTKLQVDPLPVFEAPRIKKIYDFNILLTEYEIKHGKRLKPVSRRGGIVPPTELVCPYCGAPHTYLYSNDGGKGQFWCKACNSKFNNTPPSKDTEPYCPFCLSKLSLIKKRKDFDVYRCGNKDCSYRKKNLRSMSAEQKELYKKSSHLFKLRYIYRKFNIDLESLSKDSPVKSKVGLDKIHSSHHVLGLALTYHINYGIPLRKTAALMFDIHNVKISHQTIANYCDSVAPIVKPFLDGFHYDLSDKFCGDETYIKVKGRWHYIFFFFDAAKKIILSYRVRVFRDWISATIAIDDVLSKFNKIPESLNLITDGNPIYLLARQFFAQRGILFDITQVIGLTNEDEVSKEFRPLKQIIERLNRTFKGNYNPSTGYGALESSISNVTLFVTYFNFLRPHSKLEGSVPVLVPELNDAPNMPAKWITLIKLSENFIKASV